MIAYPVAKKVLVCDPGSGLKAYCGGKEPPRGCHCPWGGTSSSLGKYDVYGVGLESGSYYH